MSEVSKTILGLKQENAKAIVTILVVIVILIFAIYWCNKVFGGVGNALSKITDALGITKSAADQARDQKLAADQAAANTPQSPWSPSFYQNAPSGALLMTTSSADDLAQQIYDSNNTFSANDGPSVVAAIKQCSTKSQVSFLSYVFSQNFNEDLYSWLVKYYKPNGRYLFDNPFNDQVLTTCNDYVNNLPKYNV